MEFQISKSEPLLIYGGGIFGVGCANGTLSAGYNLVGIIDINPGRVENSPVPVYTPYEATLRFSNAFVWICLANGLPHMDIARELACMGFKRILFLPLYLSGKAVKVMIAAFNAFCIGNYTVSVPYYEKLWDVFAEDYILDENSGFITVLIHKNHIFTTDAVFEQATDNPYSLHKTLNNPCISYIPNVPFHELSNFYKDRFQQVRPELFNFFESAFYTGSDYFINCPCACTLSDDGTIWYILDGNHRASYLAIKGITVIPVRVRRDEYIQFFRESTAQELMNYCKSLSALPFKVEHPAFWRLPVDKCITDEKFTALYFDLYPNKKGGTMNDLEQ